MADAWAITMEEFAARLDAIEDMETDAAGGDVEQLRAQRRSMRSGEDD